MREIRNECREFMTKDSTYITEEKQKEWFNNLNLFDIKMYLMYTSHRETIVDAIGYGYCRRDTNETYLTGGLIPQFRGKGYGRLLFSHLREQAKSFNLPITLEVLNTNIRAENLYKSLGFVQISKNDKVTKMEYKI